MTTTFDDLGLTPTALRAISEMGFETPTPVQSRVIPAITATERDLVALAQTGTGKTAAYGLPLIQSTDTGNKTTQTLILCPTRELCLQITRDLTAFAKYTPAIRILAVYGGTLITPQIHALYRGVHIIVATPGRMHDLLRRNAADLTHVRQVVLDEADEMLNMGFQEDLEAILNKTPDGVRTLLFSATMPRQVAAMAGKYMHDPEEITVGTRNAGSENVIHEYYRVHARDRYAALKRIIDFYPTVYGIVFCRTRMETQEVAARLMEDGYNADALHGDLSQPQRDRVMESFRGRLLQILVATDVAARGLDVTDLTHVINYNLPEDVKQYTHRSGRTGRAGKTGISVAIIHMREEYKIRMIEKTIRKTFEHKRLPSGTDICAAQLHGLLERVKQVQVDDDQIAPYLSQIQDLLGELPGEEVVKRFALLEFNRFLAYYKDAPDLDVGPPSQKRNAAPVRMPQRPTRLMINLGRRSNLRPQELIDLIVRAANGGRVDVRQIEIRRNNTLFDVSSTDLEALGNALNMGEFKGRPLHVELAHTTAPEETRRGDPRRRTPSRDAARPHRPGPRGADTRGPHRTPPRGPGARSASPHKPGHRDAEAHGPETRSPAAEGPATRKAHPASRPAEIKPKRHKKARNKPSTHRGKRPTPSS